MNIEIKRGRLSSKPNQILIPATAIGQTAESAAFFNKHVIKCEKRKYNKIIRTKSGGISYKTIGPAYDVRYTKSCVELTVLEVEGFYRLQFRAVSPVVEEPQKVYGRNAFKIFRSILKKYGIDLKDYEIDNGKEVKKEIEKYKISMESDFYKGRTIENAHHIDFHSSFPAGLANTHPEFKDPITEIYKKRKEDPIFKFILNSSIGFMQSEKCCKARWAQLSRDAINDNNRRIRDIASRLTKSGRIVIAYNTDGIWYTGRIYHGAGEGPNLGDWQNDHINCKIRFKSEGSYEFMENGKYTPVVRGATRLDRIKPRTEWEWGDIFNKDCTVIQFALDNDHIVWKE